MPSFMPAPRRPAPSAAMNPRPFPVGPARLAPFLAAAFLLVAAAATGARAADSENIRVAKILSGAYAEVVEKVSPAVVGIETEKFRQRQADDPDMDAFGRFFDQLPFDFGPRRRRPMPERMQPERTVGIGSGVVIDRDGHILTNNHVIDAADKIKIELSDRNSDKSRTFEANVVGRDPNTDLAVIRLINPPSDLATARLGDSDALKPGNIVIAIGSPMGYKQSVTTGVVSAKGRRVGELAYEQFIQTDAAINPGNSGGPLVNLDGEVVGLNTMIATRTGGSMGIGFAIPMGQAKSVIAQLIEKGKVTRGWLGITMNPNDADINRELGSQDGAGALVAEVDPSGPAAKGGLRKGDLIISYDNAAVRDNEQLQYLVADTAPGRDVPMLVIRDGKEITLSIHIEPQPSDLFTRGRGGNGDPGRDGNGGGDEEKSDSLGVSVANITDAARERFGIDDSVKNGVVVTGVKAGGRAADQGIRPGTVILEVGRRPVADVDGFRRLMRERLDKDKVLLYIRSGDVSRYVMLKPDATEE